MKKIAKKSVMVVVLMLVLFINDSLPAMANDDFTNSSDFLSNFIVSLGNDNEEFYEWRNGTIIFEKELYFSDVSEVSASLYSIYVNESYSGYVIADMNEEMVYEFSRNSIPYYDVDFDLNMVDYCIYDMGNYGMMYGENTIYFNAAGEIYFVNDLGISTFEYTIPGVSPQLQNSHNCIVAALSNVIWFWGNNGYSRLTTGLTFEQLKNEINTRMLNAGGYANNNVPGVFNNYVRSKSYTSSCSVVWDPSVNDLINEVTSGRPCMLGFAAGSTYSQTVGHMTMCYGYQYIAGGTYYSIVADGWTTSKTYKVWNQYNDCVIKLNIR